MAIPTRLLHWDDLKDRGGFRGFARTYKENDDLAAKVRDQLDGWSRQLDTEGGIPLVARSAPWTADGLMGSKGQDKPVNLLFFNVELTSFRSPDVFAERWAFVNEFACIKRVVFLLPEYKVHRLRRLLPALVNGGQEMLLQRFHVCPQKERSSSAHDRVSSGLAFVLACHGRDIGNMSRSPILRFCPSPSRQPPTTRTATRISSGTTIIISQSMLRRFSRHCVGSGVSGTRNRGRCRC